MKYIFALLLTITSCSISPVPRPPTITPAVTFAVTATQPPGLTTVPVPTVTVAPTPEPPVRSFHPTPRAVETINVLESVCEAQATTWNVWDWGMVAVHSDADEQACLVRGTI